MDRIACSYCTQPAFYVCACSFPYINFCKAHRDIHESSPAEHTIKLLQNRNQLNGNSQKALILKIAECKNKAAKNLREILNSSHKIIQKVQEKTDSCLKKLKSFMNVCDEVLQQVYSISRVLPKEVYSPLESALVSSDITLLLQMVTAPIVQIPEIDYKIDYIPSLFPHFLFNFTDLSIDVPAGKSEIYTSPLGKTLRNLKVNDSFRFLNIGGNKIIFTGEFDNDVSILDLESEVLQTFGKLNTRRHFHAMAWIDGLPAVLGGIDPVTGQSLSSVEVYKSQWEIFSPMKSAKSGFTAVCSHKATWTVGVNKLAETRSVIEKYENMQWTILNLSLSSPLQAIGLLAIEGQILIIGGWNLMAFKTVYCVNSDKSTLARLNDLQYQVYFPFNQFYLKPGEIIGVGRDIKHKTFCSVISTDSISL